MTDSEILLEDGTQLSYSLNGAKGNTHMRYGWIVKKQSPVFWKDPGGKNLENYLLIMVVVWLF